MKQLTLHCLVVLVFHGFYISCSSDESLSIELQEIAVIAGRKFYKKPEIQADGSVKNRVATAFESLSCLRLSTSDDDCKDAIKAAQQMKLIDSEVLLAQHHVQKQAARASGQGQVIHKGSSRDEFSDSDEEFSAELYNKNPKSLSRKMQASLRNNEKSFVLSHSLDSDDDSDADYHDTVQL